MYSRDSKKNLLHLVKSSVGTELFSRLYVTNDEGEELEVTEGGQLSCALFVSSLLSLVGWVGRPHATVKSTVRDMKESGNWQEIDVPLPGDVVEWGVGEAGHSHIGFVVGDDLAISNNETKRCPIEHNFTMQDGRIPIRFWRYTRGKEV